MSFQFFKIFLFKMKCYLIFQNGLGLIVNPYINSIHLLNWIRPSTKFNNCNFNVQLEFFFPGCSSNFYCFHLAVKSQQYIHFYIVFFIDRRVCLSLSTSTNSMVLKLDFMSFFLFTCGSMEPARVQRFSPSMVSMLLC